MQYHTSPTEPDSGGQQNLIRCMARSRPTRGDQPESRVGLRGRGRNLSNWAPFASGQPGACVHTPFRTSNKTHTTHTDTPITHTPQCREPCHSHPVAPQHPAAIDHDGASACTRGNKRPQSCNQTAASLEHRRRNKLPLGRPCFAPRMDGRWRRTEERDRVRQTRTVSKETGGQAGG
jgi:hypothetical protein